MILSTEAAEHAVTVAPELCVAPFAALGTLGVGPFLDECSSVALAAGNAHAGCEPLGLFPVTDREKDRCHGKLVLPDYRPRLELSDPGGHLHTVVFRFYYLL